MQVTLNIPDTTLAAIGSDETIPRLKNKLRGARQSKAAWTVKRYLIIGAASAAAGIVSDGLNRWLTATGTDGRLMSLQSVPNPKPTTVRQVK